MNEGMEALRRIATTSLFMQNEQETSKDLVVPLNEDTQKVIGKLILLFISIYWRHLTIHISYFRKIYSFAEQELRNISNIDCYGDKIRPFNDSDIFESKQFMESDEATESQTIRPNKLSRTRAPINQSKYNKSTSQSNVVPPSKSTMNSGFENIDQSTLIEVNSAFDIPMVSISKNKDNSPNNAQQLSSVSATTSVIEPEILLSPAKLGQ